MNPAGGNLLQTYPCELPAWAGGCPALREPSAQENPSLPREATACFEIQSLLHVKYMKIRQGKMTKCHKEVKMHLSCSQMVKRISVFRGATQYCRERQQKLRSHGRLKLPRAESISWVLFQSDALMSVIYFFLISKNMKIYLPGKRIQKPKFLSSLWTDCLSTLHCKALKSPKTDF